MRSCMITCTNNFLHSKQGEKKRNYFKHTLNFDPSSKKEHENFYFEIY